MEILILWIRDVVELYHCLSPVEKTSKIERVNHIVEDMLRMYVMNNPTKWEYYLHLAEFAYNNGYQTSTKMSPFELLYGQECRRPVTWDSLVDRLMFRA